MKKSYATVIFLLLLTTGISAQSKKIKWGDIPIEYMKMNAYERDTGASAVVLLDYGEYTFGDDFKPDLYIHQRIKILKTAAYDAATISVPYRFTSSLEKVSLVKASSYNLAADGKMEETKLEASMIFDEDIDGTWHQKKFTIPNVKVGTVIEYQYTKSSVSAYYGPGWRFQSEYPVVRSQLVADIPTGIEYVFMIKDQLGYVRYRAEPYQQDIRSHGAITRVVGTRGIWTAENVPAFKEEEYMTTSDDYLAKLTFQLSRVAIPGSIPEDVMNTWEELNKELFDDFYTARQISGKGAINEKADSLVIGITDPVKKIRAVYEWIRGNMVYSEKKNIYGTNDLNKVFKQRKGDLGDFALLLTLMLRNVGLDANLILTSTWENGYPQKIYPITEQFDYLLTMVEIDTNRYFLDATNPNRSWNLLPRYVTDRPGLVIQKEAIRWVDIPGGGKRKSTTHAVVSLDENGNLSGNVTLVEDGYSALRIRSDYNKSGTQSQLTDLYNFEKNPSFKVELTAAKNIDNPDAPLSSNYRFTQETGNSGEDIIYFNPILIALMEENPFKSETRTYPIDFGYVTQLSYVAEFNIPDNLIVEELPQNLLIRLPNNTGEFKRIIQSEANKISMMVNFTITTSHFETGYYPALREFFDKFIAANKDQVVLKKRI